MKVIKLFGTICVALLGIVPAIAQSSVLGETSANSLGGLTFSVKSNKATYLPYEPLFVTFELTNNTQAQTSYSGARPLFLIHSSVQVTAPDGAVSCVRFLSLSSGGGPNLPGQKFEIKQGERFAETLVPAIDSRYLEKPGKYTLRFSYSGLDSNSIEITVAEPMGLDEEAFRFLANHGKDIWFGRMLQEKDGPAALKTFVQRFESSSYGDFAVLSLGKYFLNVEMNLSNAQTEFAKLRSSQNTFIADTAKKHLAAIARSRGN
ncbi:MAG: hypothetical protein UZ17_ACD001000819 [Acidobacteria bacterium OLB17]|nr:MAG: hypothetical protein UZ17_ACD001000819 [Acidobacteria bacterium OLB17]MCZ2389747.1 hypothetical protein [Acidobacteriota bacterium]